MSASLPQLKQYFSKGAPPPPMGQEIFLIAEDHLGTFHVGPVIRVEEDWAWSDAYILVERNVRLHGHLNLHGWWYSTSKENRNE